MSKQKLCRPRSCTRAQLARAGVELVNGEQPLLKCMKCGHEWAPKKLNGRLQRGYWHCERGCNPIPEKW